MNHYIKFMVFLFVTTLFNMLVMVPDAEAGLCAGPPAEVGTWKNSNSNTRGVTKVVIGANCVDDTKVVCNGDICSIQHGVKYEYSIKVWGKCHPTDCYWGEVKGVRTSADWMRFFYNQNFATRWVWGQVWSGSDDWLKVVVETEFKDDRDDYTTSEWFRRQ